MAQIDHADMVDIMQDENETTEISANIKRKLTFFPVSHMDEVLGLALKPKPGKRQAHHCRPEDVNQAR